MIARTLAILFLGASLQAAGRPNVLFLVVDDLRASVGVFGDKEATFEMSKTHHQSAAQCIGGNEVTGANGVSHTILRTRYATPNKI